MVFKRLLIVASACAVLFTSPVAEAGLFNKQEDEDAATRALHDVQTGYAGLRQAVSDPAMLADVMESMKDPEIMAEAKKMMEDPAFQAQMKQFSNQKGFKEAAEKVKNQFADLQADPARMEALNQQVEGFLAGARAAKEQEKQGKVDDVRHKARSAAAAENFGMNLPGAKQSDGSTSARLGLEALTQASKSPALMAEAMEQMQDPEVMREVRKLMMDPEFAEQIKEFSASPHFKAAMSESAAMMEEIMKDPSYAERRKASA